MSLFLLLIKKFAVSMLSPCIFVFRFFFSFFFPVHWLNRVQKGNLNIHPITCLRTGSWSGSASGSGFLPVSQFPCSFCFLGSFYLSLILVFIFLIFGTLDFLRIIIFCLEFVAGDKASDLGRMFTKEVLTLPDDKVSSSNIPLARPLGEKIPTHSWSKNAPTLQFVRSPICVCTSNCVIS